MTDRASPPRPLSDQHPYTSESPKQSLIRLKAFFTAVMGLLSLLVFALGVERKNVLWLWIGFICAQISGIFVQLLINREKRNK